MGVAHLQRERLPRGRAELERRWPSARRCRAPIPCSGAR
jgi:hypothetical protein